MSSLGEGRSWKILALAVAIYLFVSVSFSLSPHNPQENLENSFQNVTQVKFSLDLGNSTAISSEIMIRAPRETWNTYSPDYKNGTLIFERNFSVRNPRRLEYKWLMDNGTKTEYPAEALSITLSSENQTMFRAAQNLTNNLSLTSDQYCNYSEGDFSCSFEDFQALKILLNTEAFLSTGDSKYLNRSLNYSFSEYSSGSTGNDCDQIANDFDCENGGTPVYNSTSAQRQGLLINSLWRLYQASSNNTVRKLAENYTEGVAENCPVWSNTSANWDGDTSVGNASFKCSTSEGQGAMISGYWEAYKVTGNDTYRQKALKLSKYTNFSDNSSNTTQRYSPWLVNGLTKAFRFTGNESYLEESKKISKDILSSKDNLTAREFFSLGRTLMKGYEVNGGYGFYRNGLMILDENTSALNYSCSYDKGNYTCERTDYQALSGIMYWSGYENRKDLPESVSNPSISGAPETGEPVNISFDLSGKILHGEVVFRERGKNWTKCTYSYFDGCKMNSSLVSNQNVYEYYFNSSGLRFPKNGSFKRSVTALGDEQVETASSFSDTDYEGSAYCRIWSGDFSCEEEIYQSAMMQGMINSFRNTENNTYRGKLEDLVSPPYYEDLLNSGSSCRPEKGNFSCNSRVVHEDVEGSRLQGNLINSLYTAYSETGNREAYELGQDYALNNPDDCNPWSGDFECRSASGQGSMILGYLKAYEVTSNQTFLEIAENLSVASLNMSGSRKLAASQWKAFSYTGNESYKEAAANYTDQVMDVCEGNNCSPVRYYLDGDMRAKAYLYGNNSYLDDLKSLVQGSTTDSGCGPGRNDTSCSTPYLQGSMSSLMRTSSRAIPVRLSASEDISLTSNSLTVGQSLDATCSVTNDLPNTTLENVEISIDVSEGLEPVNGSSYSAGDLGFSNTSSNTWSVGADEAGEQQVVCEFSSTNGLNGVIQEDISVSEKQTEEQEVSGSSDDSDSEESASTPSAPIENSEEKNITHSYSINSRNYDLNESFLGKIGINTTLKRLEYASSSCYSARRNVLENKTILNLDYRCGGNGFYILDRLPGGDLRVQKVSTTDTSVEITYDISSNMTAPSIVSYKNLEPIDMDVSYKISNKTRAVLEAEVKLNRRGRCVVKEGEKVLKNRSLKEETFVLKPLDNGSHVNVECGDEKSSYQFISDVSLSDSEKNSDSNLIFLIVILGLSGSSIAFILYKVRYYGLDVYINSLIDNIGYLRFMLRLKLFRIYTSRNKTVKAIKQYEKLRGLSHDYASEDILSSDIELVRGVRLYILLDMVEKSLEEGVSMPEGQENLGELIERYLSEIDNPELENLINEKVEVVNNYQSTVSR